MKFPAIDDSATMKCAEAAAAHCKIDAFFTLIAILFAYVFWLSIAVVFSVAYLVFQPQISGLALLPSIGITPPILAAVTHRWVQKLLAIYVEQYVRNYFRVA